METDVTLERVRDELTRHGWAAHLHGDALRVRNPDQPGLAERITCRDGVPCWSWGQPVWPSPDAPAVARQIMRVLRTVVNHETTV